MKNTLIISLLFLAAVGQAAPFLQPSNPPPVVAFSWDSAPGVTWKLYYGVGSRQYTNAAAVSTNYLAVTLPARGVPFFFSVTAVAANGLESAFSSEVTYTAPAAPPVPTGFLAPVVLTVQFKASPEDFMWADLTGFAEDPLATNRLYRLAIARGSQAPQTRALTAKLPPLPGQ